MYWTDIEEKDPNFYDKAVNRIQLNRTNRKYCDHKFFDDRVELVEKWSSCLPGLTQLRWYLLDKRVFQHLVNLEELIVNDSINQTVKVDSNIFACNKNLRKLTITHTVLSLDSQSFNGLVNLTELFLISCEIDALPDGLFDSCAALKVVDLCKNKFIKFETSTFQNLVNLEKLNLSDNPLQRADYSNIVARNKNLRELYISGISSTSFNKQSLMDST